MSKKSGRPTYDAMRSRGITTLALYRLLVECDIIISQKSIQNYLDVEFENCPDDRIKEVAKAMIKNHDDFKSSMINKYGYKPMKVLRS